MADLQEGLHRILRQAKQTTTEIAEVRGELGSAVKDFCDTNELHKGALTTISRLDRMSQQNREAWLETYGALLLLAQEKWATENTGDLFKGDDESDEDGEPDDDDMTSDDPFSTAAA